MQAPEVEPTKFSLNELLDAYLMLRTSNPDTVPKSFPIKNVISGEDGKCGYRYLVFPALNENLYLKKEIFNIEHLSPSLESKY